MKLSEMFQHVPWVRDEPVVVRPVPVQVKPEFRPFPKIPRLNREVIVTEKIDGTNASVYIDEMFGIHAASRNRWIYPGKQSDNFDFASWVALNREGLIATLGPGHHFGEWYGRGIARGYGLSSRRFALFNVTRWAGVDLSQVPGLEMVPVLGRGLFQSDVVSQALSDLNFMGSYAVRGWNKPEGVVVYHDAAQQLFKVTIEGDEYHKGYSQNPNLERHYDFA